MPFEKQEDIQVLHNFNQLTLHDDPQSVNLDLPVRDQAIEVLHNFNQLTLHDDPQSVYLVLPVRDQAIEVTLSSLHQGKWPYQYPKPHQEDDTTTWDTSVPTPVYAYSQWCSDAIHFETYTRQGKFEVNRSYPVSKDCFDVYNNIVGIRGPRSALPNVAMNSQYLHLLFEDTPRKEFPFRKKIIVNLILGNRAWFASHLDSFYVKFATCCTERCIVVVFREPPPNSSVYWESLDRSWLSYF